MQKRNQSRWCIHLKNSPQEAVTDNVEVLLIATS